MMKFSSDDKKKITDYYEDHLRRHGIFDPQAMSWSSQEAQIMRFQALLKVGQLEGKKILDVGCGLGDLYQFLKLHLDCFDYLGIDLLPAMIEGAKQKYPGVKFEAWDVIDYPKKKFDYVLSSGAFSFKVPDHKNIYLEMIKKIFSLSRTATVFNMLDREGHVDDDLFAAWEVGEVEEFCKTLTKKIKIIRDYSPQDFTVFLYH